LCDPVQQNVHYYNFIKLLLFLMQVQTGIVYTELY